MMQTNGYAASGQTMSRKLFKAALAVMVAAVCACAFTLATTTDQAEAATALTAKKVSSTGTWTTKSSKTYYKVSGKKVTGLVTIGTHSYYFDSDGVQRDGWRKIGYSYYFFRHVQGKNGYMRADTVVNGIKLNKRGEAQISNTTQVKEVAMYVKSQKIIDSIASPGWTKEKKLKEAFAWVNHWRINERVVHGWTSKAGWHRMFANDVLDNHCGDCYSMGCAMAYLGNAVGCSSVEAISSGGHGWARIDGKIYDPEATPLGGWTYYAADEWHSNIKYGPNANYVVKLTRTTLWKGTKLSSTSSGVKNGIVKSGSNYYFYKNGVRVYSAWAKWNGSKYYLKSNGAAAKYSYKVGSTYYIFGTTGKLKTGDATRVLKIGDYYYRVNKYGKAAPGWTYFDSGAKRCYYGKTGKRAVPGITLAGTKLVYLTSPYAQYSAAKSEPLQAAAKAVKLDDEGILIGTVADYAAAPLLALMDSYEGGPDKILKAESCVEVDYHTGTDIVYTYDHVIIQTFLADDESFEVIWSLTAR